MSEREIQAAAVAAFQATMRDDYGIDCQDSRCSDCNRVVFALRRAEAAKLSHIADHRAALAALTDPQGETDK